MLLFSVPLGRLEVDISCHLSPICPDVRSIPENGVALQPGDLTWMLPSHCPIIIATAGAHMIVACGSEKIVDEVIASLTKLGAKIDDIAICMQFLPLALEPEYIGQAQYAGVRNIWATHQECPSDKYNIIVIERTA